VTICEICGLCCIHHRNYGIDHLASNPFAQRSESGSVSQSLSGIGSQKPIATSDCDADTDSDDAFPAALSG